MTEKELLERADIAYKNLKRRHAPRKRHIPITSVDVVRQGNFTLVTVNGNVVGMSKRHCNDQYNPLTGFHTALGKALRHMLHIT
jgi:hypothetical protein